MARITLKSVIKLTVVVVAIYIFVKQLSIIKISPSTTVPLTTSSQDVKTTETFTTQTTQIYATEDLNSDVRDWHNYTQIKEESERTGPGEQGTGVIIPKSEQAEQDKIYRENGFDGLASDKMSIQRSLRDIRHHDCKTRKYLKNLPSVSVIIPFHQEHWSTLIRTVDSVTRRSPQGLIKEVLLVDDASRKPFLKKQLEIYLNDHYPVARVIRTNGRQGLIRTRVLGAKEAKGDVLIFLDSHCEANVNWLPPLLEPIAMNYKTVTCPFIDVLNMDTFEYSAQDDGARGIFDWNFLYKRTSRLRSDESHPTDPFDSPVMAGGLFAISRQWFWELGGYDEGLDIWGGEQYEISFKIWQCGGRMVDTPCSRIGHVYRKYAPFPNNAKGNFLIRNFKRVAEVWMDEYKEYLYLRRPEMRKEDPLNLTNQLAIRERLHCKNFSWFMQEVAFDLVKHYPLIEPSSGCTGELRFNNSNNSEPLCMDFKFGETGYIVGLSPCLSVNHKEGGEQNLILSWKGEIRSASRDMCLDCNDHNQNASVLLFKCHGIRGNQLFRYKLETNQIIVGTSQYCLKGNTKSRQIINDYCDSESEDQKWTWTNVNITEVKKIFELNAEEFN